MADFSQSREGSNGLRILVIVVLACIALAVGFAAISGGGEQPAPIEIPQQAPSDG